MQSHQDDIFPELECFLECVYINLMLAAIKRTLTEDEVSLLQGAAELMGRNGKTEGFKEIHPH